MPRMKRFLCLLLTILLLAGCKQTVADPVPTEATGTEAVQAGSEPAVPEDTQPEPVFDDYTYQYEDPRDLDWEKDVVYLAQLYLGEKPVKGHPYLVDRDFSVCDLNSRITTRRFYKPELREAFIAEIFALIDRIPELSDTQITFELQRIVALLQDAHSSVWGSYQTEYFPFTVEPLSHLGKVDYYAVMLPKEHEDLILARLDAINGVPLDEIIRKLSAYVSTENSYWAAYKVTSIYQADFLADKAALQTIGVMEPEADSAVFQFTTLSDETVEIELEALSLESGEYHAAEAVSYVRFATASFSDYYLGDCSYWYTYLEDDDALYLRFYEMLEEEEYRLDAFMLDVRETLNDVGGAEKVIIDLRYNPGGYHYVVNTLLAYLQEFGIEKTYVLINEGSCSAAVVFSSLVRKHIDGVMILGTPAGQPPNFFADQNQCTLLKHDITCSISYEFLEGDPEFTGAALVPDVFVYQKLKDYIDGKDTVLQAALDN